MIKRLIYSDVPENSFILSEIKEINTRGLYVDFYLRIDSTERRDIKLSEKMNFEPNSKLSFLFRRANIEITITNYKWVLGQKIYVKLKKRKLTNLTSGQNFYIYQVIDTMSIPVKEAIDYIQNEIERLSDEMLDLNFFNKAFSSVGYIKAMSQVSLKKANRGKTKLFKKGEIVSALYLDVNTAFSSFLLEIDRNPSPDKNKIYLRLLEILKESYLEKKINNPIQSKNIKKTLILLSSACISCPDSILYDKDLYQSVFNKEQEIMENIKKEILRYHPTACFVFQKNDALILHVANFNESCQIQKNLKDFLYKNHPDVSLKGEFILRLFIFNKTNRVVLNLNHQVNYVGKYFNGKKLSKTYFDGVRNIMNYYMEKYLAMPPRYRIFDDAQILDDMFNQLFPLISSKNELIKLNRIKNMLLE